MTHNDALASQPQWVQSRTIARFDGLDGMIASDIESHGGNTTDPAELTAEKRLIAEQAILKRLLPLAGVSCIGDAIQSLRCEESLPSFRSLPQSFVFHTPVDQTKRLNLFRRTSLQEFGIPSSDPDR